MIERATALEAEGKTAEALAVYRWALELERDPERVRQITLAIQRLEAGPSVAPPRNPRPAVGVEGEAGSAAFDFFPAPRWRRWLAAQIDGVVWVGIGLLGAASRDNAASAFVLAFVYVIASHATDRLSPGKRALGLFIVDRSGQPLGVGRAIARGVLFALFALFAPAMLLLVSVPVLFRSDRRGVHDLLVGSMVTDIRPIAATNSATAGPYFDSRPGWQFYLIFGLATATGYLAGAFISYLLIRSLPSGFEQELRSALSGSVVGLAIGLLQLLALGRRLGLEASWILFTTICGLLGALSSNVLQGLVVFYAGIFIFLSQPHALLALASLRGVLYGVVIGYGQSLVLEPLGSGMARWTWVSGLVWLLAFAVSSLLPTSPLSADLGQALANLAPRWMLTGALLGLGLALGLAWLTRSRRELFAGVGSGTRL